MAAPHQKNGLVLAGAHGASAAPLRRALPVRLRSCSGIAPETGFLLVQAETDKKRRGFLSIEGEGDRKKSQVVTLDVFPALPGVGVSFWARFEIFKKCFSVF